MTQKRQILIATGNHGKAREIEDILISCGASNFQFLLPQDVGIDSSPDESGENYEENAVIKAEFYGSKSGILTFADDSGLEVDALDGFPGLKSARLVSIENSDKSRYETLLDLMVNVPETKRTARFVCVAAAYIPETSQIITARAEWNGRILVEPDGAGGFGYDPVFFDNSIGKSAANLTTAEKNQISHRGKAFKLLWKKISAK